MTGLWCTGARSDQQQRGAPSQSILAEHLQEARAAASFLSENQHPPSFLPSLVLCLGKEPNLGRALERIMRRSGTEPLQAVEARKQNKARPKLGAE